MITLTERRESTWGAGQLVCWLYFTFFVNGVFPVIESFSPEYQINLADELQFLRYSSQPGTFKLDILGSDAQTIFVDEIQRIPALLNTIQTIIDANKSLKFYLTGSSARKLKRGQANLLPGRVFLFHLGPLVSAELNYGMETQRVLEFGSLPEVYLTQETINRVRTLKSYTATYLKEEIKAEALVRNLESFARFLQEATAVAGEFVDFTKLAIRSKISRHAIPRYFEILEDTLIGYRIFPFTNIPESVDLVKHPKFYFFDNGVYNGLLGNFTASRDRIGKLAEQLVFSQLHHSAWAAEKDFKISTFRTRSGIEVDFILELDGKIFAIEVKNSDDLDEKDMTGLNTLQELLPGVELQLFVFHMQGHERKFGKIRCLPWQKGLKAIGL